MLNENKAMRVLAFFGIIFVAAGHLQLNILGIDSLFPYYSFHVYIFLFIAGYFYKEESELEIGKYIKHKVIRLLVPYFVFNLIYGLINTLLNQYGYGYGSSISLYSLIIAPFEGGHQYMLNAPSWFMISLFLVEVVNVCIRALLRQFKMNYEWLITAIYLILGIATVYLAIGGHIWGWHKDIGRIFIMLPGFAFGSFYGKKLEEKIPKKLYVNIAIMLIMCALQIVLIRSCAGLAFSTVWVTGFANGPIIPFISVITGVIFTYNLSVIIVYLFEKANFLKWLLDAIICVGRNTEAIMLHHIFIFFLINSALYITFLKTGIINDFDVSAYRTDVYYTYGNNWMLWVYLVAGIVIPTLISKYSKKVKGLSVLFIMAGVMVGCGSKETDAIKAEPYVAEDYIASSEIIDESRRYTDLDDNGRVKDNPNGILSVPTYITKIKDNYFIVDCYHNSVIYSDSLENPLYSWKLMTEDLVMGHTIASDGEVYLIDDTENNRILVMEEEEDSEGNKRFYKSQEFKDIGKRPHYIIYDEKRDTFYAWSSLTGKMYLFRHEEGNSRMYLTKILSIPELDGYYVRSFTIIEDDIFFVSGNMNIIKASADTFEIKERFPVSPEIAGMVQLTKIDKDYYITVSTDAEGSQDAATIIKTDNLNSLAEGKYEDVYSNFIGGGTPYCITKIDDNYYLCEHRLPGHSIWRFSVKNGEIADSVTLF